MKVFGDKEGGLEDFCLDDLNFDALRQWVFSWQRGIEFSQCVRQFATNRHPLCGYQVVVLK